jgi:hypothetical protein
MDFSEEARKNILKSILETVEWISDKGYQKRVWIHAEGPEVNDFCETCCRFSPEVDDIIENYKYFFVSEEQKDLLEKFTREFYSFRSTHYNELEFIDSPEWHRITEMAKEVLKAFDYKKSS